MARQSETSERKELKGLLHFSKEMISAFGMALICIVYIVQAFKIPTSSMENSLLIGDQLLGLKFMYGAPILPFLNAKFPGVVDPKTGDPVIFKSPNNSGKSFIKRCVAGPGQIVEIKKTNLYVDGKLVELPPDGQYLHNGEQYFDKITYFDPLRIPSKGDTIYPERLPVREFLFFKHLVRQENPGKKVRIYLDCYVDGKLHNSINLFSKPGKRPYSFDDINNSLYIDSIDNWTVLAQTVEHLEYSLNRTISNRDIAIKTRIYLDGRPVNFYIVKKDNYFMLGDNRDNSLDSRYWGYVNRRFIQAKPFIIYFSLDENIPLWLLPFKIRWNRIGKLIRRSI
jgi:signal peptidase I